MSDWWWIILLVLVIVAVAAFILMRGRNAGVSGGAVDDPSRNYRGERETDRLGGMSDEDRAWESASLERNRQRDELKQPPRND